jgi:short-subunit dehydrogenase
MRDLRGRNALVTGAAGGLGGYIARALAAEGVNLALSDLPSTNIDPLADELRAKGVKVEWVPADLTDIGGLETLARHSEEAIGPLDILVNNAGIELMGAYTAHTRAELEAITQINLLAPMELTRVVISGMQERGAGHVVNIASIAGKVPVAYLSSYNATKYGLVGFTHSLRFEYGDEPIGFSAICPVFINRVGMLGRVEDQIDIPAAIGTMPPEAVGDAVVIAITENKPEVIVKKRMIRPMIMLASVAPRAAMKLGERLHARDMARDYAQTQGRL